MSALSGAIKARARTAWHEGRAPRLMNSLAWAYAREQWLKHRWSLRSYERGSWLTSTADPAAAVEFAFDSYGKAFAPLQSRAELTELAHTLQQATPRTILELGTARGGTFFVLTRMAADDATIISVDLPAGIGGGGYPAWKMPILRSFATAAQKIHLFRLDSHAESTFEQVRATLGDKLLDVLFIDADHSYDGMQADYERYSTLVRPGGLIFIHDVVPNPFNTAIEVDRFWAAVSSDREARVIKDPAQLPGFGIGVLTA